jgi:hypothetical protein
VFSLHLQRNDLEQGCQLVYFQTKNSNLGKFWRALDWKIFIYFMDILEHFTGIWNIYDSLGTFCARLVHFFRFWYHVPRKLWQPCRVRILRNLITLERKLSKREQSLL